MGRQIPGMLPPERRYRQSWSAHRLNPCASACYANASRRDGTQGERDGKTPRSRRALVSDQQERFEILKRKKSPDTSRAERVLNVFVITLETLEQTAEHLHQEAHALVRFRSPREPPPS
jgi:hypothetical protein